MKHLLSIDADFFRALNGMTGQHPIVDALMIFCARAAPIAFAFLLAGMWLSWKPAYQWGALLAAVSALLALGIGQLVGMALPRARPYESPDVGPVTLLIQHAPDTSFPSDHATLAFAVTALLFAVNRKIAAFAVLFSIWLAVSRVYVGAHYPSDVLGGAVLGTAVARLVVRISRTGAVRQLLHALFDRLHRAHLAAAELHPGR